MGKRPGGGGGTPPFGGTETVIEPNWLEREISSASAEIETWPAWKREAMRREIARGGLGSGIEG